MASSRRSVLWNPDAVRATPPPPTPIIAVDPSRPVIFPPSFVSTDSPHVNTEVRSEQLSPQDPLSDIEQTRPEQARSSATNPRVTTAKLKTKRIQSVIQDMGASKFRVLFECSVCSFKDGLQSTIREHLNSAHPEIPMEDTKWLERADKPKQVEPDIYECELCDYKTRLRWMLKRHLDRHAGLSNCPDKQFTCVQCDKTFLQMKFLRKHTFDKHESRDVLQASTDKKKQKTTEILKYCEKQISTPYIQYIPIERLKSGISADTPYTNESRMALDESSNGIGTENNSFLSVETDNGDVCVFPLEKTVCVNQEKRTEKNKPLVFSKPSRESHLVLDKVSDSITPTTNDPQVNNISDKEGFSTPDNYICIPTPPEVKIMGNLENNVIIFQCGVCSYSDACMNKVSKHSLTHFGKKRANECPMCKNCFASRSDLLEHVKYVHKTNHVVQSTSLCCTVPAVESGANSERLEVSSAGALYVFECKVCFLIFDNRISRDKHYQMAHSKGEDHSEPSRPVLEEQQNSSKKSHIQGAARTDHVYLRKDHARKVNEEKTTNLIDVLKEGIKRKHLILQGRLPKNTTCTKESQTPSTSKPIPQQNLEKTPKPTTIVTGNNKFKKLIPVIMNTGDGKLCVVYKCSVCSFAHKQQITAEYHYDESHKGVPKFTCPTCEKDFPSKLVLHEHLKFVTCNLSSDTGVSDRDRVWLCPMCDVLCGSRSMMSVHLRKVHASTDIFHCEHCGFKTKYKKLLAVHIWRIHMGVIPCSLCHRKFRSKINLIQHMKVDHIGRKSMKTTSQHGPKDMSKITQFEERSRAFEDEKISNESNLLREIFSTELENEDEKSCTVADIDSDDDFFKGNDILDPPSIPSQEQTDNAAYLCETTGRLRTQSGACVVTENSRSPLLVDVETTVNTDLPPRRSLLCTEIKTKEKIEIYLPGPGDTEYQSHVPQEEEENTNVKQSHSNSSTMIIPATTDISEEHVLVKLEPNIFVGGEPVSYFEDMEIDIKFEPLKSPPSSPSRYFN